MEGRVCGTCEYWKKETEYEFVANTGVCSEIGRDKITINLELGWDGGFVRSIETDEDFGCNLYKKREEEVK